jgi:hypothetical protein
MAAETEQSALSFLEPLKTVHETRSEEVFGTAYSQAHIRNAADFSLQFEPSSSKFLPN